MDVLFLADILESLRPDGDGNLAEMRFVEQQHLGAGLADASTDAQWDIIVDDRLVVGELEEIELVGELQLFLQAPKKPG